MDAKQSSTSRHGRDRIWWLVPKPFDIVSSSLYLGVLFTYFSGVKGFCACNWWLGGLLVCCILALLSIDRLEYWRYGEETPARVAIALLVTRVILIEAIAQIERFSFSAFLYLILPYLASLYFGKLAGYLLVFLAELRYLLHFNALSILFKDNRETQFFYVFTLGLIFVVTIARTVATEKASRARSEQLFAELQASHQQLKVYSEQVADLATTRERNRLARDIHDTLGHYLTVINVQLEKALAFHKNRPAESEQAMSDAKRLAHEALRDVRQSVAALRASQDFPAFRPALLDLVERTRGMHYRVEVHIEGDEESFAKPRLLTLYHVVQEALTNVQKHADARNAWVDVHFDAQKATLKVRDDGRGFDPQALRQLVPGREGGYGLQGIQERLEIIGGAVHIESEPGKGTQLTAIVPRDSYIQGGQQLASFVTKPREQGKNSDEGKH